MKTLIVLFTAVLCSADAMAGMLYTYRTPGGDRVVANRPLSQREIEAGKLWLQEAHFTPDLVPPRIYEHFPPMRAGVTGGPAAPEPPRQLFSSQPLNQPLSIEPISPVTPVTVPAVSVQPVPVQRFTVEPVTVPAIVVPPPVSIPAVTIPAITVTPVTIQPIPAPAPVTVP